MLSKQKKKILFTGIVSIIVGVVVGTACALPIVTDTVAVGLWRYFKLDTVALAINRENSSLPMKIGFYYFNHGGFNLQKSEKAFEQALLIEPKIPLAHYQLGRIYFIKGNFSHALTELEVELEYNPENLRVHYVRGLIYGFRNYPGDLERAEEEFKSFIKWSPKEWAGYNDLAWIQIRLKKYSIAKKTVSSAFENAPWTKEVNPWLWTAMGIAELNLKNYNEAKDIFLNVERISNGMTAKRFWSAYPGNNQHNAKQAFNQFKSTLHFNLGVVYENLMEWKTSIQEYEKYLALLPKGPYPRKTEVEQKINELSTYVQ